METAFTTWLSLAGGTMISASTFLLPTNSRIAGIGSPTLTALPFAAAGTLIFVPFMLVGRRAARHVPDKLLSLKGATQ